MRRDEFWVWMAAWADLAAVSGVLLVVHFSGDGDVGSVMVFSFCCFARWCFALVISALFLCFDQGVER